ncbi:MAG: Cdc6/Cdc18 family protein [Promethearchaeota archaeon]
MSDDLFKKEFSKGTVFRDEKSLDHGFVPDELPRRGDDVKQLIHDFRALAQGGDNLSNINVNVLITGNGGVGKTATSRFFASKFAKTCRKRGVRVVDEYFNCLEHRTKSSIYRTLLSKYCYQTGKGYGDDETVKQLEAYLRRQEAHMILVLDEVHMLPPTDILAFLNLSEILGANHSRFSTILVSRPLDWARVKDQRIEGRIRDKLKFTSYSFDDLMEILTYRRSLAFKDGALPDDTLKLIVEIAADTKDARHGIDIMFQAGKKADSEGSSEVTPEMVRLAKDRVFSSFRIDSLDQFKEHEKLAALGVARALKTKDDEAYIVVEDGYDYYRVVCDERGIRPHTITSFRKYLRTLTRYKIVVTETVQARESKRGRHARITVQDIPAARLEEILEKLIDVD